MRKIKPTNRSSILWWMTALLFSFSSAVAMRIDAYEAQKTTRQWLKNSSRFKHGQFAIKSVETVIFNEETAYFVVNLSPSGFVILAPDECLEPVIAFSTEWQHVPDEQSPLYQFAKRDMTARLRCLRRNPRLHAENAAKWKKYLASSSLDSREIHTLGDREVRVEPLIWSIWGQQDEEDLPCYDYYTPPGSEPDGDPNNNIRCGCVATAMAQVMRYNQHPSGSVGVSAFSISVNGNYYTAYTRGGDGAGGPYQWTNMPLDPGPFTNDIQRQAIGALCHDAGLTVNMSYSPSGSAAAMRKIHSALSDFFQYSCAVYGIGSFDSGGLQTNSLIQLSGSMPMPDINRMINPGLDAGYPSILGIDGPDAGHAVVVDGYCYQEGTLYHHLNMGWYGRDNVWYALPDVTSMPSYDVIDACIYNIFPDGTGEIVSGRVIDPEGLPMENVSVSALLDAAIVQQDMTDANGIYALAHLPSEHTYMVRAEKQGCRFADQVVYIGKSGSQGQPHTDVTGNVWGVDFQHPGELPPLAIEDPNIVDSNSISLVLTALDEGMPNPPGRVRYFIEALPRHGRLYDPNFGQIIDIPHELRNDANSVIYEPCKYFWGLDSFAFKANDGGVPPGGGDSNTAEIWLDVMESQTGGTDYFSDYPLHTWKHDSRTQLIYTAAEFGHAKRIGAISLHIVQPPPSLLTHFRIRMQPTALIEYPLNRDFVNTGWTNVYEADEWIVSGGWRRFNFQTPFDYNGRDNILLDISFDNWSWAAANGLVYGLYAANQDISQSSDSQHGDPQFWTISMFGGYLSENMKPSIKVHAIVSDVLTADFNTDCRVNLSDLLPLMDAWLTQAGMAGYSDAYDIAEPSDDKINLGDFAALAFEWLESVR
ncbi:MAG: C10 family peptidase [Planctomycetaceae bacterium]|nr:C10 family peptidase [Planctomycetaceae bacterium]